MRCIRASIPGFFVCAMSAGKKASSAANDLDRNIAADSIPDLGAENRTIQTGMPQPLLVVLRVAALVYLGLCCAVFLLQRSFLYFPQPPSGDCPTTITLPVQSARVLVCARPAE